jgi:hypothetical protein
MLKMPDSNEIQTADSVLTQVKMPDGHVDIGMIARQLRLCRAMLGAILDELECGDAGNIAGIAECATGVTAEIEGLWDVMRKPN